ncbi:MAG: pentapeptide repeat-containing protein [Actinomycetota bacterium]
MRRLPIPFVAAAALALPAAGIAGGVGAELPIAPVGTGAKSCVLKPRADCRGVVQRWTVEHHGNLRKAKFTRADLRGADFRGADVRGADFRGAKLRYVDFRGAKLKGARFDAPAKAERGADDLASAPSCLPACAGADLTGANLFYANLSGANLSLANLTRANLIAANLTGANLISANLSWATIRGANLSGANVMAASLIGANLIAANLSGANLAGVLWFNTTCPDATVTNTGC